MLNRNKVKGKTFWKKYTVPSTLYFAPTVRNSIFLKGFNKSKKAVLLELETLLSKHKQTDLMKMEQTAINFILLKIWLIKWCIHITYRLYDIAVII